MTLIQSAGKETSLPKMADGAPLVVEVPGIFHMDGVQSSGERIRLLGNAYHVDMVRHEAVCPDVQIALGGILGEKIQVLSEISRFCEDRLPVIPPLCDVVRVSDGYGTGYSWHGENYKPAKPRMSMKNRFLSLLF
jgi:hypothetical protein